MPWFRPWPHIAAYVGQSFAIGGTRLPAAGGKTLTPTLTLPTCLLVVEMPTLITMLESPFCFAPDCSSSLYWPSGKSRPVRQIKAEITCMASGMRKVRRQDKLIFLLVIAIIMLKMTGVRAFVTPPPRLPQPAAVALAVPTFADPEALLVQKLGKSRKSIFLLRAASAAGSAPNEAVVDVSPCAFI